MSKVERLDRIRAAREEREAADVPCGTPDGAAILAAVHAFLGRFVAYPSPAAHDAHVLWVAHTHMMAAWESTPRIAFLSPEPGSGKTRALEITETLVPRPVSAVNVSPAYLFRKVAEADLPPTILFDEIDTVFGPKAKENEEIRGLLNAGHRRGAKAGRCVVRGKQVFTEELPAFAAVALAGLGFLPDTIMSRSVLLPMRRRAPHEQVEPYRRRIHAPQGEEIRDRLAAWAATIVGTIGTRWPNLPAGITDRAADVWEPLIAVADAAGGDWPERSRVSAVSLVSLSMGGQGSLGVQLLTDIKQVFGGEPALFTNDILNKLYVLEESPWNDLKGKPLNARGLAMRLKPYGIARKQVRIGLQTNKGYERADFADAWARYLPSPPKGPETSETSGTDEQLDLIDRAEAEAIREDGQ